MLETSEHENRTPSSFHEILSDDPRIGGDGGGMSSVSPNDINAPSSATSNGSFQIDKSNYTQMIKSLSDVFTSIESPASYQPDDLKFFEEAAETLLINYWDTFDSYKGRVFRNKLKNRFRYAEKNDTFAKIRYFKSSLEEVVHHMNNSHSSINRVTIGEHSNNSNNNNFGAVSSQPLNIDKSHRDYDSVSGASATATSVGSSVTSFGSLNAATSFSPSNNSSAHHLPSVSTASSLQSIPSNAELNSHTNYLGMGSGGFTYNQTQKPDDVSLMFGSGDLIYSRNFKANDGGKRLKVEEATSFPRIGTDIFTNDLQINAHDPKSSSASNFLNYPNFNPKLRRFNYDLSKNNMISSILNNNSHSSGNTKNNNNNNTNNGIADGPSDHLSFHNIHNLLSSISSTNGNSTSPLQTKLALPTASSSVPDSNNQYPSDVYEFVSALNNLKHGTGDTQDSESKSANLSTAATATPASNNFHRTPEYIQSLKESMEFLPAQQQQSATAPSSSSYRQDISTGSLSQPSNYLTSSFLPSKNLPHQSQPPHQPPQPHLLEQQSLKQPYPGSLHAEYYNTNQSMDSQSDYGGEEKVFKCENCHLSFKRNSDLKRHIKIHLTVLPHICNNCGKSFARKDALKRHYGTLTCNRNKENMTYIDNLKYLTEEEKHRDLSVSSRKKKSFSK